MNGLRVIAVGIALALLGPLPGWAKEQKRPATPEEWETYQAELEKRNEAERKRQAEQMEEMRRADPNLYRRVKEARDRQAAMDAIMSQYRSGEITAAVARKQLTPHIREKVMDEAKGIDHKIDQARKAIQRLQLIKNKPEEAIREEIDALVIAPVPASDQDTNKKAAP